MGNGKRYLEAAPLGDDRPRGAAASFQWRVRWNAASGVFEVVHGRRSARGETTWDGDASVSFDPTRLVHYSFFHEHFARARRDPANAFLHGLRFAVFPRLDAEVSLRDAHATLGSTRFLAASEGALVAFARQYMSGAQFQWLREALEVLRAQGDLFWQPPRGGEESRELERADHAYIQMPRSS